MNEPRNLRGLRGRAQRLRRFERIADIKRVIVIYEERIKSLKAEQARLERENNQS